MRVACILTVLAGLSVSMARPEVCLAAESATASVVVTAQIGSRTRPGARCLRRQRRARGQDYEGEDEEAVHSRRADARGTDIRAP